MTPNPTTGSAADTLERLHEVATAGPWGIAEYGSLAHITLRATDEDCEAWGVEHGDPIYDRLLAEDAALIVALRNAAPAMVALIRWCEGLHNYPKLDALLAAVTQALTEGTTDGV